MKRTSFLLLLCLVGACEKTSGPLLVIYSTDYVSGAELGSSPLDPPYAWENADFGDLHRDSVLREQADRFFLINRFGGDSVQVFEFATELSMVTEFVTGAGSNPQDVAVVGDKAYVSRYGAAQIWVMDLATDPPEKVKEIDLSGLADADGIPEMNRMAVLDSRLYVALQRLTGFAPSDYSSLAVIDVDPDSETADQVVGEIQLTGKNPITDIIVLCNGMLAVGNVGLYGVLDGGVDRVDPVEETSLGFLVTEEQLGGDIGDLAMACSTSGYATVTGEKSQLVVFSGEQALPLYETGFYQLGNLAMDRTNRLIFLADRTPDAEGIRVFDMSTNDETEESPFSVGELPPLDLAVVGE